MASLVACRAGIAANLSSISSLRVVEQWPDAANLPAAVVVPSPGAFIETLTAGDGEWMLRFDVIVLVSMAGNLPRAQQAIDAYCETAGATSVRAAIESNRTLSGAALYTLVQQIEQYGAERRVADIPCLSAVWKVEVTA